ncbi:hypothetical protein MAL08_13365 [Leptospira noguchii]|nr:hypothetical protein [Leptospira noguchii]UOG37063.1 hypothetical protein MAL08_13365 [Leptospira noguchii]
MKLKRTPPELSISLLLALEVTQRLASIGARQVLRQALTDFYKIEYR